MTNNPFWGEEDPDVNDIPDIGEKGWYHIKARDMSIFMPEGKVIKFWLHGDSEKHIREILKEKEQMKNIEWIRREKPPFA